MHRHVMHRHVMHRHVMLCHVMHRHVMHRHVKQVMSCSYTCCNLLLSSCTCHPLMQPCRAPIFTTTSLFSAMLLTCCPILHLNSPQHNFSAAISWHHPLMLPFLALVFAITPSLSSRAHSGLALFQSKMLDFR
jgi:hypothetical protein